MLRSILVRGLHDNELKGFLAKEQSSNRSINFHQLVTKIKEYVLMCKVVDSGTDIEARFAVVTTWCNSGSSCMQLWRLRRLLLSLPKMHNS